MSSASKLCAEPPWAVSGAPQTSWAQFCFCSPLLPPSSPARLSSSTAESPADSEVCRVASRSGARRVLRPESGVGAVLRQQLRMRARLYDAAVLQDYDPIGVGSHVEAVGHQNPGAVQPGEVVEDLALGEAVDRG